MKHLIIYSFLLVAIFSSTVFAGTASTYRPQARSSQETSAQLVPQLHTLLERMASPNRISPLTQDDLQLFNNHTALLTTEDFAEDIFAVERHVTDLALQGNNKLHQGFHPILDNLNQIWQQHFERYLAQNFKENFAQNYFADVHSFEELLPKMDKIRKEYQRVVKLLNDFERCSTSTPRRAQNGEAFTLQCAALMSEIYHQFLGQVAALMQEQGIPAKFNPPQDGNSGFVSLTLVRSKNKINIDPQKIISPALAPLKFLIERFQTDGKDHLNVVIGNSSGVRGKDPYWKLRVLAKEALTNGTYNCEHNTLYLDDGRFFYDPIFLINSTIVHELTHASFGKNSDRIINTYPLGKNEFIPRFIYTEGFTTDEVYARVNSINYLIDYFNNSFPADSATETRDLLITEIIVKLMETYSFVLTTKQLISDLKSNFPSMVYAKEYVDRTEYLFNFNSSITSGNRSSAIILTANQNNSRVLRSSSLRKVFTPNFAKPLLNSVYKELGEMEPQIREAYQTLIKEYRYQIDDLANHQDFFPDELTNGYFLGK